MLQSLKLACIVAETDGKKISPARLYKVREEQCPPLATLPPAPQMAGTGTIKYRIARGNESWISRRGKK